MSAPTFPPGADLRAVAALTAHPSNYNRHGEPQIADLATSLRRFGQRKPIVTQGPRILAGHGLVEAARRLGWREVWVAPVPEAWTEAEARAYLAADNELARAADPDTAQLAALVAELQEADAELARLAAGGEAALRELLAGLKQSTFEDPGAQVDRAEELREQWGVESGQLWACGEHRIVCGDCTDAAAVARVMGGEQASLVSADPPYGMGKENEGITNDNLYREKLDAFQMSWWRACRSSLADNGSAYIWGNAEDLWRLWYVGGLRDSERLTLRNEIVWDKGDAGAGGISHQGAEGFRMYPNGSERCLFFMLGEQGFNINADNYWEGWDGIVEYLEASRQAAGWSIKDTKRIAGHSEQSGCHWFDKSQWSFPTEETYKRWQTAARGNAFKREYDALKREYDDLKREYDDLKREFYATRAYFDNTHDNMTDVWQFSRVQGEDRQGHATPKPVDMIERIIKSSAPDKTVVYAPFSGTGPEIIACEKLSRKARAVEISPAYVAVALQRWADMTQQTPVLLEGSAP